MGGLFALTVLLTSRENVSEYEQGLLQFILFAAGAGLTYFFGALSVKAEAQDLIQRDARKAVRRIVNLASGVQDFAVALKRESDRVLVVAAENDGLVPGATAQAAFDALAGHIPGQLRTLEDAIEDWRDIVPEQVADLERRAKATLGEEGHE
jgi:hypothetical protein